MKEYHIPIFVSHRGCPFQCVFCNQTRITGESGRVSAADVKRTIGEYLATLKDKSRFTEAAFFGGSFTGIAVEEQEELLGAAYEFVKKGDIDGIRVSTRPDYISPPVIERLLRYGVTTVELGVQSMDEEVLKLSGRGHSAASVENAVALLKKTQMRIGLQMMTGLPGDTMEKSLYTAGEFIRLRPQMVRIYPTLVIKSTMLNTLYEQGLYRPQTVAEAVQLSKRLVLMFREEGIEVIRVGLQPTEEIREGASVTAGPYHPAFGELVESEIFFDMLTEHKPSGICRVRVNPADVSKVVGQKRRNIKRLEQMGVRLEIIQDKGIKKGGLELS